MNLRFAVKSLKGAVIGLAAAVILTLVFSLAAHGTADPGKWLPVLSHISRFAGAFVCGAVAARSYGGKGLLCGAAGGLFFSLLITFVSAVGGGKTSFLYFAVIFVGCAVCSLLAGLVFAPREKSGAARRRELIRKKGL